MWTMARHLHGFDPITLFQTAFLLQSITRIYTPPLQITPQAKPHISYTTLLINVHPFGDALVLFILLFWYNCMAETAGQTLAAK